MAEDGPRGSHSSSDDAGAYNTKRQKVSDSSAVGQPAQAKFLYQHRLLQEGVEGAPVKDESSWLQCDLCDKWRPMPIGTSRKVIPQLAWVLMSPLTS